MKGLVSSFSEYCSLVCRSTHSHSGNRSRYQLKRAYNALQNAGIHATDRGPWNVVWDGDTLTVIDFVDPECD